jgi:predicted RNase H-like nuclease
MVPTSQLKRSKTTLRSCPGGCTAPRFYGVDGCKAGWILADYEEDRLSFSFHRSIGELIAALRPSLHSDDFQPSPRVFIDIPIGLPEKGERACDREGRELLGARRATLFPVPARSAVYAPTFQECGDRNLIEQGKRVSIQFWNIAKKVIELDQFLQNSPEFVGSVCEGHPELAFRRLCGKVLTDSKHTAAGRAKRLTLIEKSIGTPVGPVIDSFIQSNRKLCSEGDLLDAASLAILGALHKRDPKFVGDGGCDGLGIPMKIAC